MPVFGMPDQLLEPIEACQSSYLPVLGGFVQSQVRHADLRARSHVLKRTHLIMTLGYGPFISSGDLAGTLKMYLNDFLLPP